MVSYDLLKKFTNYIIIKKWLLTQEVIIRARNKILMFITGNKTRMECTCVRELAKKWESDLYSHTQ